MAQIYPFQPFRYTAAAGELGNLLTQPYDKITAAMRTRYQSLSPYNLVRVILGEPHPGDSEQENVYTRSATYFQQWIGSGILARDAEAGIFPYFQEFSVPDTGERMVRRGFIALGKVEEYSAGIVHRHEQTLSGPKKDRRQVLESTHAHFGQIFMLYADPACAIDAILDAAAAAPPLAEITDEYGTIHRLWKLTDSAAIQKLMADKKLLIADGHHRYETALGFHADHPGMPGADRVMMTFVNMHSPGLKILATHRLVNGVPAETLPAGFLQAASAEFDVAEIQSLAELQAAWSSSPERTIIGAAIGDRLYSLTERSARGALDVRVLHDQLLGKALGISEQAVRDEQHLRYIRGVDQAVAEVRKGAAQIAFLLKPTRVEQVAETSFGGGVMPQKSTDFYPKLLTGLAIYKLD